MRRGRCQGALPHVLAANHCLDRQPRPLPRNGHYADKYQGRLTANGERFNQGAMTAAHKSLPFGTHVRVVNRDNSRSVVVHINDRGLFIRGRIIDLSYAAFSWIEHPREGLADGVLGILD